MGHADADAGAGHKQRRSGHGSNDFRRRNRDHRSAFRHRVVAARDQARAIGFVTPMIQAALWIVLFLFADRLSNPLVFVSAIMFAISFSSPVANFGFDTIREKLDRRVMVAGTGMANMGAYICAMLATQIIGFLLDWNADGHAYTWSNFQVAWLGLGAVWLAGMIGLAVCLLLQRRKNIAFRR